MKVVTGTFREDRHGDAAAVEAQIDPAFPQPPAFLPLSDRARQIWQSLSDHCGPWTSQSDWPAVWGVVRMIERIILNHEAQLETDDAVLVRYEGQDVWIPLSQVSRMIRGKQAAVWIPEWRADKKGFT